MTFIFSLLLGSISLAQSLPQSPGTGVSTDDLTFGEIYEANLKQSKVNINEGRKLYDMEFSYAYNQIGSLTFSNNYFEIPYSDQVSSQSSIQFYSSFEMYKTKDFSISPTLGVAYTYDENIIQVRSTKGGVYRDVVKFQAAPLFLGAKFAYKIPWYKGSSLFTRAGVVNEWLSITGTLDGINQSYWTLGYSGGLGVSMWESDSSDIDSWFGGLLLTAGANTPFSSNRNGRSVQWYELGLRFLL